MTSDHPVKRRKKLIEVAIPLEAINAASAREKSIRHGHPSTLHLWWARRPLAAARAVIFCQMVDDPSAVPEEFLTEEEQEKERLRLFALISELVQWESTTNEQVLNRAREEIRRSWRRCCTDNADHPKAADLFNPDKLPGFHDPFAGGGALPLEAQRLGLESYASDLNPVAVLINKAMIEIPPRFAGMPPVNPESRARKDISSWTGAQGLAEDVCYYGKWMRDEAEKRIGNLYPKVPVTSEMVDNPENPRPDLKPYVGQELTVIAWIWARTVKSPNPAFADIEVPLVSTYVLASKPGKEAYVEPIVGDAQYRFVVRTQTASELASAANGTKIGRGGNFRCIMSGTPISPEYIKSEGIAGRIRHKLLAIVAEGQRSRVYLSPTLEQEKVASSLDPKWRPDGDFVEDARAFTPHIYGLKGWRHLFSDRQTIALSTFSDLVEEASAMVTADMKFSVERESSSESLSEVSPDEYRTALSIYLSFSISRSADFWSSLCTWANQPKNELVAHVFTRQALAMVWDFAEANPFSEAGGGFLSNLSYVAKGVGMLGGAACGRAQQADAASLTTNGDSVFSTDPPYYDNIYYADLSDFFYVWLRRSLKRSLPELFATIASPKDNELVATAYRHGGKEGAESHFLRGMRLAMKSISSHAHQCFPVTLYYAFKQTESKVSEGSFSTGWETFLAAVIDSGLSIVGTWPIRTEREARTRGIGSNALATSVVLVCVRRHKAAAKIQRSAFRRELLLVIPSFIRKLENANIAPVDVAQAAIGPGMAIFSQAKAVLNPDDSPMSVREALIEINAALDEYLSEDEGSFDADTRFALTFFESYGYSERPYGDAEGLAVARNISVQGVANAGILSAIAGKVRLLRREQLDDGWDPSRDDRLCVWEATQHLIKALEAGGEAAAAALMVQLKQLPGQSDLLANCRALAYRLYNHCEKTKQAEEGRAYNGLVIAWQEIERQASNHPTETAVQASLI